MAISAEKQLRFWAIGFLIFLLLVWLLSDVLLPFTLGMAIAYLLDPVCNRLEAMGAPRWLATSLLLLLFTVFAISALLLLVPLVIAQASNLLQFIVNAQEQVRGQIPLLLERLEESLTPEQLHELQTAASAYIGTVFSWLVGLAGSLWSGGIVLFDVLSVMVITPVVAFYLLRDWNELTDTIDRKLPREHAPTIRALAAEVDNTLASFVRGQATVCLLVGLFYAIALTLVDLRFGLLVGLLAGLISFVPYLGSLTGFMLSVGLALYQYDDFTMVLVVAGIFLIGQAVEGNFLTPKLVGESVRLHPVWVMFALLAGASLFGIVGVLVAVPVAAILGVLVRFGVRQYMASRYYTGLSGVAPGADARPDPLAITPPAVSLFATLPEG